MKRYLEQYLLEYVLCLLIAAGLAKNIFAGFDMSDYSSGALCLIFGAVTIGVSAIVFWVGRAKSGIVLMFLSGSILASTFSLLKYPVALWAYLIFFFGTFALFFCRIYAGGRRKDNGNEGKSPMKGAFVRALLGALIVCALAGGTYVTAIRPFSEPVDETKLAEKLMSIELLKDLGMSSKKVVVGEKPEKIVDSPQIMTEKNKKEFHEEPQELAKQQNQTKGEIGESPNLIQVFAVTYKKRAPLIWSLVAISLSALALAVLLKKLLRRKWHSELLKKTNEDYAIELYQYFIKTMGKIGMPRPKGSTLSEYTYEFKENLEQFSVCDATFLQLTHSYIGLFYGYQKISEEEKDKFQDFYKEFHHNLRDYMGKRSYCLRYFLF